MDANKIVAKYTGVELAEEELWSKGATANHRLLFSIANKIESVELRLARAAAQLLDIAERIESTLEAQPGERFRGLNSLGEFQGNDASRIDALIAERSALIESLQMVMSLDRVPAPAPARSSLHEEPSGTAELRWPTDETGREVDPAIRLRPVKPMTIKGFND